ncbi:MAG: GNAT family N-acetyltransferase [Bacillota bacterium]
MSFTIKNMTRADMDVAIDWAATEGWNPGLSDAEVFFATDPNGFFMAWEDERPIGAISAVRYGPEKFGFVGFFIVVSDKRGGTVGPALAEVALKYLHGYNIGQDGVLAKVKNYATAGFKLAYSNFRYGGLAGNSTSFQNPAVRVIGQENFADICAYDRQCFPAGRESFLDKWFCQPGTQTVVYIDDGICGYGVIRRCRSGYKIGPLFADNADIAEQLFLALTKDRSGEQIFLDVPETNAAAVKLAEQHQLQPVFATARMYNNGEPALAIEKIFGVTTFELG